MTYCVGMMMDKGLVLMSDTRTNSGVDNISTFRKMFSWQVPGERMIAVMTAGNLATTQSVISLLEERGKAPDDRNPGIYKAKSMFQVATLMGNTLKEVIASHVDTGHFRAGLRHGLGENAAAAANIQHFLAAEVDELANPVEPQRIDLVQRPEFAIGVPPAGRECVKLGDLVKVYILPIFGH